jgi:hypothetical protein
LVGHWRLRGPSHPGLAQCAQPGGVHGQSVGQVQVPALFTAREIGFNVSAWVVSMLQIPQ